MAKRLLVIDGADEGQFFPLLDEGTLTIGSSRRNTDICLHDLYVRRVHCQVEIHGDQIVIRDTDELPTITVNGQQVARHDLRLGDVVRVGNTYLRLETDEESSGSNGPAAAEPALKVLAGLPQLPAERLAELTDHTLAHYEIGTVLGQGHTGVVFRARDLKGGHMVALKVLAPDFPAGAGEMQQFVAALKAVLPLRHPNLITLYNAGKTGPYCWLALEYVEGESLAQILERIGNGSKPNWKHGLRLAVHVARALDFLHQHRLTHGNLTPRNILLRLSDKVAKVSDLMLSKALDGSALLQRTLETKLLSELPYLAPEQADPNAFVDNLSDIYGLGAVVYARLTGRPPFQGASPEETLEQIHEAALVKPRHYQSNIPHGFEVVVVKMLARRQEERYATVTDLLDDLQRIAEHEGVPL